MRTALLPLLLLPFSTMLFGAGCRAEVDDGAESDDPLSAAQVRTMGSIYFGQTIAVPYTESPLYRSLQIEARAGDVIDAWVRGENGADASALLVDASNKTLASNDDADATTKDAHVRATVDQDGTYSLVLRNKKAASATFHVSVSSTLVGLPDGTYHVPLKVNVPMTWQVPDLHGLCNERPAILTVTKKGDTFSVAAGERFGNLVATGTVSTGAFTGKMSTLASTGSSLPSDGLGTSYPLQGSAYRLEGSVGFRDRHVSVSAVSGYGMSTYWEGTITNTVFGQDTLPPGAQRANLHGTSACTDLNDVTLVRMPDGKKLIALPRDHGDIAVDDELLRKTYDCRPAPWVSVSGGRLRASRSGDCSFDIALPDWFTAP